MAARVLHRRLATEKTLLPLASYLFPKRSSPALFSTICQKSKHFNFSPPPEAKKVPFTAAAHGVTWNDPYRWMSDINDPDFTSYLDLENSYAAAFMADTENLQRILYSEMASRMPTMISTPPERWGCWLYYQCVPEGKEYPVLCRKSADEGKKIIYIEFVFIGYVHVGTCRVSPDHTFLAYTLDTSGDERFQLQIKDLRNNSILPQSGIEGVVSLAWAQDGSTLFYTLCDQNQRPYRQILQLLAYLFRFLISIIYSYKYIFISGYYKYERWQVYVINSANPKSGLQRFCKRVSGVQYFLEHHCGIFYGLTNAPTSKDKNFSGNGYYLARCRDEELHSTNLQDVIMPGEDICIEDMDIFNGHLVLFINKKGSPSICSIDMPIDFDCEKQIEIKDLSPWFFPLPSNMCTITPGSNHDFMNDVYRVVLSSPVVRFHIILQLNFTLIDNTLSRLGCLGFSWKIFSIVQQEDVRNIQPGGTEYYSYKKETSVQDNGSHGWKEFSEKYICEEKEVVSIDGVKVPLTILFCRSAYRKGQSSGLLHGYGAYGEVLDKSWCPDRLSLLDRGWVFAFADVRGGAGADPSWHISGRGLNKLNSIHDFVSCGKYLINEGLIHKNQLSAVGISAGCLLVGAAINMHPELFRAAILKVPFLDVLNTLLDPDLPLTTLDYEEFGNPETKLYFEYIRKYSPYDNIPRGVCCPSMLVSASFNDSRVGVWEAAKWVAKIRDTTCSSCSSAVILQTNIDGGHFREGGRFARCWETAYDYAFLTKVTGASENSI
ncbi:hypothetical protein BUALT_Bualt17G0086100 [Buddleja alternifolia]|uniref:Prolyl endopeptidase n=1 Tax=Buddleja alternifolia TaxID=168488 RepID=A0AAV6WEU3_9LAMI|nr:hypothetical protein BUALT_Bualt17G0086100 [Buddleja alternifolia]